MEKARDGEHQTKVQECLCASVRSLLQCETGTESPEWQQLLVQHQRVLVHCRIQELEFEVDAGDAVDGRLRYVNGTQLQSMST
jgi:hypothetical protein